MTYVITDACVDVMDRSCVDVCPVDCIYTGDRKLYINPVECIECGACEPECPVDSIMLGEAITPTQAPHIADNAAFFYEVLPGRDGTVGDPGGAEDLGPVGVDTRLVAALPPRERSAGMTDIAAVTSTATTPTGPTPPTPDSPGAGRPGGGRRRSALVLIRKRLLHLIVVLLAVTFLSFVVVDLLPGDAAVVVAGDNATPAQVEAVRTELHLDRPLLVRYVTWLGGVVQGDLGRSFRTNQPVTEALGQRIPVTFELTLIAELVALLVAVPLAVYSAYRPGRVVDRSSMTLGFGGAAMPQFVLGMVLIVLFAGGLTSILPATGYMSFFEDPLGNLRTIILPCLTLMVAEAAVYRQLLRSDMISTLQEDFILMARSKGLSPRAILLRHALRPSSFSLITLSGVNIGRLLGGTVIVETLFAIPGLGQMIVQAVFNRDYMLLQGGLLFVAVAYVVINMLIDLLYLVLDPRVRRDA